MAIEDVISATDALEFQDVEAAVLTERFLLEQPWPCFMRAPVKRWMETTLEVGHVQRDRYGCCEPVVYVPGSRIGVRRYSTVTQLVQAGWRAD